MGAKDSKHAGDARWVKKAIQPYLDGMGEYTAKVIIRDHVSPDLEARFDWGPVTNLGRYYYVRLVGADGAIVDDLLVDKQSGAIISAKRSPHLNR